MSLLDHKAPSSENNFNADFCSALIELANWEKNVNKQHPLLYLKGVKFTDLQCVLNFLYHGEVNVGWLSKQKLLCSLPKSPQPVKSVPRPPDRDTVQPIKRPHPNPVQHTPSPVNHSTMTTYKRWFQSSLSLVTPPLLYKPPPYSRLVTTPGATPEAAPPIVTVTRRRRTGRRTLPRRRQIYSTAASSSRPDRSRS